jgi:hypothetical protein
MPQESMLASVRAILLANAPVFALFGPTKARAFVYLTLKSPLPRKLVSTASTKTIVIPSGLTALGAEPHCRFSPFSG